MVNKATRYDDWIAVIHILGDFTIAHMEQFDDLWIKLKDFHFEEDVEDTISFTPIRNTYCGNLLRSQSTNMLDDYIIIFDTSKKYFLYPVLAEI
jgi:hypothetical protein